MVSFKKFSFASYFQHSTVSDLANFDVPISINYYNIGVVLSTANSSNRPLLPKRRKKNSRKSAQFDPASATINRIRGQVLFIALLISKFFKYLFLDKKIPW